MSAFGYIHPRLRGPRGKPIRDAINSWWPPTLVLSGIGISNIWIGTIVLAAISLWMLHEFLRLLPGGTRNRFVEILAYLTVPLHYGLMLTGVMPFGVITAIWIFGILPLAWVFSAGTEGALVQLPATQFGIVLTVLAFSHISRLFMMGPSIRPAGGAGLAGLLLTATWSNDAAQFVFGKLFGRQPMASLISPNKTWEGFAGGLLATSVIGAAIAPMVTPFDATHGALIGAALSIAGSLGDLLISAIKRDAGVKDTGAVLPQHGGILDRCDSLLLAAPLYFYAVQFWLR